MTYWITAAALLLFGFITGFSIGQPFFAVGLAMMVLGPVRHRPRVFWPPMSGVVAFYIGYLAIAPFTCIATAPAGGVTVTVCSSLLGIRYSGTGIYNPSLLPGQIAGLVLAGVTATVVAGILSWRGKAARGRAVQV